MKRGKIIYHYKDLDLILYNDIIKYLIISKSY